MWLFGIIWTIFILWLVADRRDRNDDYRDKPGRFK